MARTFNVASCVSALGDCLLSPVPVKTGGKGRAKQDGAAIRMSELPADALVARIRDGWKIGDKSYCEPTGAQVSAYLAGVWEVIPAWAVDVVLESVLAVPADKAAEAAGRTYRAAVLSRPTGGGSTTYAGPTVGVKVTLLRDAVAAGPDAVHAEIVKLLTRYDTHQARLASGEIGKRGRKAGTVGTAGTVG